MIPRKLAFCALAFGMTLLQAQTPPDTYTITQINSMFGSPVTLKIYRNGSKAALVHMDGAHSEGLYDLATHQTVSWDTTNPSGGCATGTFSGSWGDPFADSKDMLGDLAKQNAKKVGTETIAGISGDIMEFTIPQGAVRAWLDMKNGLVLKAQLAGKTLIEISSANFTAPPVSVFTMPAGCSWGAPPPPPLSSEFSKATTGPASANSCTVMFRVVKADSMEPMTGPFQVAIDPTYDVDHPPSYVTGVGTDGHMTYSGGGIKELTAQLKNGVLRIDNTPKMFNVETAFGNAGSAGAVVYRQCAGPQTVLLLVLKNPARIQDGSEWLWVKSGKYATVP